MKITDLLSATRPCCRWFFAGLAGVLCLAATSTQVQAKLVEEQTKAHVKVKTAYGKEIEHDIVVTIFRDDAAPTPYPAIVLNHGRSGVAQERAGMGRAKYSAVSRWLTRLGFIVAIPTRVGYGDTGGEDVEDSGLCSRKIYPPVYAASAEQTLRVLESLRARDDVAKDRAVLMGQSFGGTTAITLASMNPAGVQATINFAGGGGGDPKEKPQNPCGSKLLEQMFGDYGKSAKLPSLWVYTENDMYFGPTFPKEWFDAFKAAGGVGEYVRFPAHGKDGHGLFTAAPEVWQPRVLDFLRANGYPSLDVIPTK